MCVCVYLCGQICVCVYVWEHVCICLHVLMYVQVYMHACGSQGSMASILLYSLTPCFLGQDLSMSLELTNSASLAIQQTPGIPLSHLLRRRLRDTGHSAHYLMWVLEIWTQALRMQSDFVNWAIVTALSAGFTCTLLMEITKIGGLELLTLLCNCSFPCLQWHKE